ncbi:hypothetical protein SISSUDRAFT_1062428 [Sistotremastrum suecicum HHB10207 ss-3]|uniref:Uncharacterized protein n=1 Tax=Sistotremastrum suecicum HHB10207 ss-3 TaxID=1314776 RepID=A0A166CY68_9AGAM|nr:hypothetical protein SISSUDRAFT_1062428 [Sistotremastrum suecicum HHB10207 ss-3]
MAQGINTTTNKHSDITTKDETRMNLLAAVTLSHRRKVEARGDHIPSHWLKPFPGAIRTDDTYRTWRIRLMKYLSEAARIYLGRPLEERTAEPDEGRVRVRRSVWKKMPVELLGEVMGQLAAQGMAEGLSSRAHSEWYLAMLTTPAWLETAPTYETYWAAIDFSETTNLVAAIRSFCHSTPIRHVRHDLNSLQIDSLEAFQADIGKVPAEEITDLSLSLKLSQVQIVRDLSQLPQSSLLRTRLSITNDAMPEPAESAVPDLGPVAQTVTHLCLVGFEAPLFGCKVRTKYDIIMISAYMDINILCPIIPDVGDPSVMSIISFFVQVKFLTSSWSAISLFLEACFGPSVN